MAKSIKENKIFEPDFLPVPHLYSRPGDGLPLDSVTTIIKKELGIYRHGSHIWAKFGTDIHRACQWHDEGKLKEHKVDRFVTPYLERYIMALKEQKIKVLANEIMRYDAVYFYAGTLDQIAKIDGRLAVIDIKTGDTQEWFKWQTAAYANLIKHEYEGPIARFCLHLWDKAYYLKEFTGKNDLQEFMVLNAAYKVKANAGYYRRGDGN